MKANLILPCLRGVIGDWVYYSSLMSAEQINTWIKTAKDIREAKSLDEELQRDLKERKIQISKYLLTDNSRFFNSIIIGVFDGIPEWREFDLESVRKEYSENIDDVYIKESIGLMIFNGNEKMFAIDGQHRVAGIQLSYEIESKQNEEDKILKDDQFSVIFVAHNDDKLGMKRTRKLFSDINKNAKPVAKRDKIIIDEQDISAIVTRRILSDYKYFRNGKLISLSETTNLETDNVEHFTNITNLFDVVKLLRKTFKLPKNSNEWAEENVQSLKQVVFDYLDFAINSKKEYHDFFVKKKTTLADMRNNNKFILFRPVGFLLFTKLYIEFAKRGNICVFEKNMNRISFEMPESPYSKILWYNGKMETKGANQTLAYDLTFYLLNEYPLSKEANLLNRYRQITKDDDIRLPEKII